MFKGNLEKALAQHKTMSFYMFLLHYKKMGIEFILVPM
jgi:hypothetical protein